MIYIIVNTEAEAIEFSTELWDMCKHPSSSTTMMFSIRPNFDKSKWAVLVDSKFKCKIKSQEKADKFKQKHDKSKFKKNDMSVIYSDMGVTGIKLKDLDKTEWEL